MQGDLNVRSKLVGLKRFHHVPRWPSEFRSLKRRFIGMRGNKDHGAANFFPDLLGGLNAIDLSRHRYVHEYNVWTSLYRFIDRRAS
jgi:hypothetical protein